MASGHGKPNHDYHLVDPSPWPIAGAAAAFILTFSFVVQVKDLWGIGSALPSIPIIPDLFALPVLMVPGFLAVFAVMWGWWADVIREGEKEGHHTPIVQIGLRYGMLLFIASEIMFFVAFFWAYFDFSLFPRAVTGGVWPPEGTYIIDPLDLPLFNTLTLLLSGVTVTWAHHMLRENNRQQFLLALGITVVLGVIFTAAQIIEYMVLPFSMSDGIYPTTFYLATGFHGFHVIVGTIFLLVCFFRGLKGHFKPDHHFGFEAAAWYWHFVDVVWIFLYVAVYFGVFANLAALG